MAKLPKGLYQRGSIFWTKVYQHGRPIYQSTGTSNLTEAKRILDVRRGAAQRGESVLPQVDRVRSKQLSDETGKLIKLPLGISTLNDEVPPLDVTERTKLVFKRPERVATHRLRSAAENPDTVDCPRLLRLDSKRRGEETARQAADEHSAVHYSIT